MSEGATTFVLAFARKPILDKVGGKMMIRGSKHGKTWTFLAVVVLLLAACAGELQQERPAAEPPSTASDMAVEEVAEAEAGAAASSDPAAQVDVQEQLIIRTGDLEIVVADTEETLDAIVQLAEDSGGWVVSSRIFQSGQAKSGDVTIRVPVEQFDEAINQIEEMALDVERVSTSGEDVTEEYVDLQARLRNKEATAERVRGFLEEAQDVEEALAVDDRLSRLEGEIESLRGRIQYLEQSAAFSTINVSLTPDELSQPIEVGEWRLTGVLRDAIGALVTALQGLATIAIWVAIVLLPLALLIIVPLWILFTLVRRWRRRRATPASEES